MGDVKVLKNKWVNVVSGEVRIVDVEIEEEWVWDSVINRGGERGDMDGFDNELCNLVFYVGGDVWDEICEKEGLDSEEWERESMNWVEGDG